MIRFNFEGNKIEVPTEWAEVTVDHFIKPGFLSGNPIKLLATLAKIDPILLANAEKNYSKHFDKAVKFVIDDPLGWKRGQIDQITLLGKTCQTPRDLENETFGQKLLFGQMLAKHQNSLEAIPEAVAIYLAPKLYPKDWFDQIEDLTTAIKLEPIRNVYNIADFFLSNTPKYPKNG